MKEVGGQVLFGIIAAIFGAALQWALWLWIGPSLFILFYPAVIISSLLSGLFSGIAATLVSMVLAAYIFFPPAFNLHHQKLQQPMPFLIFMISGMSISFIVWKMKRRTIELATERASQSADRDRSRLLENMLIGFSQCEMLFDNKGNPIEFIYKNVNPAFEEMHGFKNVIGKKVSELMPTLKASNPEIFELFSRVALGGPPEAIKIYVPDIKKWFAIKAYCYEKANQFAAMFDDITAEKLAEEALRENEERFRFIIEQSPLSIQILDPSGNTIKVSKSFENLWGLSMGDLQNYNILKDQQLEHLGLLSYLRKCFAGEVVELPTREYDTMTTLGKGHKRSVSSTAYPIKDYQGHVRNVVLIHEDVTESERAKAATLEAKEAAEKAAKLKSRFLDIAAHELRTPVTAFSLIVQLAQSQLEKGRPVDASTLARLRSQAERISRLVIDLLDVSRLERNGMNLQMELTDLLKLIADALNDFTLRAPKRNVVFLKPPEPIQIKMDSVRINQVISNLLDNALKYTPKDSPLEISIERKPDFVRVAIKDHGPGISKQKQATLFTPFTRGSTELTARSGGLGLGLYICRRIVELHGGKVGLVSEMGVGSTFYFELPAREKIQ